MMVQDFGCLPFPLDVQAGGVTIATRMDFAESMARVKSSGRQHEGWMYPTLPTRVDDRYEPYPYPEPSYVLPLTHQLRHGGATSFEHPRFLISAVGFLLGFRLLPDGHRYLRRTPMRSGLATDLIHVDEREMAFCLPYVDATWTNLPTEQKAGLDAAIKAYQTALAYGPTFEQFTFLYSGLDAIWRFHRIARGEAIAGSHAKRPEWLCRDVLDIALPDWAQVSAAGKSPLSELRNKLIHEALYGDKPFGEGRGKAPLLGMQALVSRAIVKALDIPCRYVNSPATTEQMHGLDLLWHRP